MDYSRTGIKERRILKDRIKELHFSYKSSSRFIVKGKYWSFRNWFSYNGNCHCRYASSFNWCMLQQQLCYKCILYDVF
jgi:hypothetical protein